MNNVSNAILALGIICIVSGLAVSGGYVAILGSIALDCVLDMRALYR